MCEVVGVGIERISRVLSPLHFVLVIISTCKRDDWRYSVKQSLWLFWAQDGHDFMDVKSGLLGRF